MNDWEIKKFLTIIFSIQIATWGLISLDALGLYIPILRQVIGFIYLTFVPGILILRILKLHKLSSIETLLYTVGLSLSTLMFTGFFMNMVYPLFGISSPISLVPLIITISIVVLVLCVLCYVRDKDFSYPSFIDVEDILSPPALFLCLIPSLSIFGTYLMNYYGNNILLMSLLIIIGIIIILIAFDKFISKDIYPLAVFVISISLLYFTSLISNYLWGWDIHHEFYLANLVTTNSIWDSTISTNTNAMLSIVMLAPIFSNICKMNLIWVFKIIYPLLYSLVPLGLYRTFQKQTSAKIAFLSVFYFMATFSFYGEMLALARQQIAELFFVLLILPMINKSMDKLKRSFLFIMFGTSLVVSHYGLSYIYMFYLISALWILILVENPAIQGLINNFRYKFSRKQKKTAANPKSLKIEDKTISLTFVLLFISFTLAWYTYVSSSSAFNTIVQIGNHIVNSIIKDFLSPETAQGLSILVSKNPPMHEVTKILHIVTQFFIVIGMFSLLLNLNNHSKMEFDREYIAFALISLVILFACISVPYFSASLQTTRFYHIAQFTLAPFCVIGCIEVFKILYKIVRISWADKNIESVLRVMSVFFTIFLLFHSGFIYKITGETADVSTTSLIALDANFDFPRFNEKEVSGANWLHSVKGDNYIYADEYRWLLILSFDLGIRCFPVDFNELPKDSYVYFGTLNVIKHEVAISSYINALTPKLEYTNSKNLIKGKNKIFDNGGAEVYW